MGNRTCSVERGDGGANPWLLEKNMVIELPEICAIEEFFKMQQDKPPWLRATACYMTCFCKKCRPICQ